MRLIALSFALFACAPTVPPESIIEDEQSTVACRTIERDSGLWVVVNDDPDVVGDAIVILVGRNADGELAEAGCFWPEDFDICAEVPTIDDAWEAFKNDCE